MSFLIKSELLAKKISGYGPLMQHNNNFVVERLLLLERRRHRNQSIINFGLLNYSPYLPYDCQNKKKYRVRKSSE